MRSSDSGGKLRLYEKEWEIGGYPKLQDKLAFLLQTPESEGTIPFNELDIKSLKGKWKDFFRMRAGKVRVVFSGLTHLKLLNLIPPYPP
jgi:mRNA-degrading endonuclease RelE of RelBE toxin-antitoxin system